MRNGTLGESRPTVQTLKRSPPTPCCTRRSDSQEANLKRARVS
jgi:hypothetical protein